jgi:hypothetical protein
MSQRCQWLRCDMHSGVNDSAKFFSKFAYLHSSFIGIAVQVTAVSMTPLCKSQQCQWLCCSCHSGVNDSDVHVTAVSMTLHCASHSSVNDSNVICTAVSMTPLNFFSKFAYLHSSFIDIAVQATAVSMTPVCKSQQCQWLCCACHSGVNDSTELLAKFASLHSRVIDTAVMCQWHRCATNFFDFLGEY